MFLTVPHKTVLGMVDTEVCDYDEQFYILSRVPISMNRVDDNSDEIEEVCRLTVLDKKVGKVYETDYTKVLTNKSECLNFDHEVTEGGETYVLLHRKRNLTVCGLLC